MVVKTRLYLSHGTVWKVRVKSIYIYTVKAPRQRAEGGKKKKNQVTHVKYDVTCVKK